MASPHRRNVPSLRPLAALWAYLRPYRMLVAISLLSLLIASAALLALPIAFRELIDHGMTSRDRAQIDGYFLALLVAVVVLAIFGAMRSYLVLWLGERVVADLRADIYRRVIYLDATFFDETRTGAVLSRLTADAAIVQSTAGTNLSRILRSSIQLFGALALSIAASPSLAALVLVLVPAVTLPLLFLGRRLRLLSRRTQDRLAETSGVAGETLSAIQVVQAFTLESEHVARFERANEDSFAAATERNRVLVFLTAVSTVLIFAGIIVVLWRGAHRVLANEMTVGQLSQFVIYGVYMGIATSSMATIWAGLQRVSGAMERLLELRNARPRVAAPPSPRTFPTKPRGQVTFDSVSFSYPSRPQVTALKDINLTVEPGENVAFVGPSGAGKSTVFQLLLRFYDPSSGRVLLDGVDISQASPHDVRKSIGLVPQETTLFAATARENIRYGRPDANDDEIKAAAIAAGVDAFVRELPDGYDTFLGDRGARLSGGQRQRIAIARAFLRSPAILLLDEATSSLDAENERHIQLALARLMRGRTTLVIAHRLATVVQADRIVLLSAGQIRAIGTHAELLRTNELYARLAALQLSTLAEPATA